MEKVNIIFVLDQLTVGTGVSSIVLNYYRYLEKEKFNIDFIVSTQVEKELEKELNKNGSKIYYFPSLQVKNLRNYKKKLEKFFEQNTEYKIIHGHIPALAFLYMPIAKKYKVPVRILHAHNARGSDKWYKRIRNQCFYRKGVKASNQYAACSKKAAEFLFGKKIVKQGKVKLIKNAILIEKFLYSEKKRAEIRKKYQLENKFVIGHVGRFSKQKNHKFLIKFFAEFHKIYKEAKLLLIGDGEEKQTIQKQTIQENIKDEVLILETTKGIEDMYQAMDVFVLPSKFEGLPLVCIEAQAAGLYCFVSDKVDKEVIATDYIEQIPIEKGIRVWIEALKRIKERQWKRGREKLKEKGYDIKTEAKKLEKFYLESLKIKEDKRNEKLDINI